MQDDPHRKVVGTRINIILWCSQHGFVKGNKVFMYVTNKVDWVVGRVSLAKSNWQSHSPEAFGNFPKGNPLDKQNTAKNIGNWLSGNFLVGQWWSCVGICARIHAVMLFCIFMSDLLKGMNSEVTKVANYVKSFGKTKREIQMQEVQKDPAISGDWEIKW